MLREKNKTAALVCVEEACSDDMTMYLKAIIKEGYAPICLRSDR